MRQKKEINFISKSYYTNKSYSSDQTVLLKVNLVPRACVSLIQRSG